MKPFTAHMHAIKLRLALSGAAGYIQCDMGEGRGRSDGVGVHRLHMHRKKLGTILGYFSYYII